MCMIVIELIPNTSELAYNIHLGYTTVTWTASIQDDGGIYWDSPTRLQPMLHYITTSGECHSNTRPETLNMQVKGLSCSVGTSCHMGSPWLQILYVSNDEGNTINGWTYQFIVTAYINFEQKSLQVTLQNLEPKSWKLNPKWRLKIRELRAETESHVT